MRSMKQKNTLVFREFQEEDCENLVMMPMHQEDLTLHGHDFFELTYITGGAAVHALEEQAWLSEKQGFDTDKLPVFTGGG